MTSFGPRRAGKTEAMLDRAARHVKDTMDAGSKMPVTVVHPSKHNLLNETLPRLRMKLSELGICLFLDPEDKNQMRFIATSLSGDNKTATIQLFDSETHKADQDLNQQYHRINPNYFYDHSFIETQHRELLAQWLSDSREAGWSFHPWGEQEDGKQSLRAIDVQRFKQEYECNFNISAAIEEKFPDPRMPKTGLSCPHKRTKTKHSCTSATESWCSKDEKFINPTDCHIGCPSFPFKDKKEI